MMNRLFNWTFGSFFRTLGRFLFYLLIGFLISQLINISDIKLPSLFNVLQVEALQVGGVEYSMPSEVVLYNNIDNTTSNSVTTQAVSNTSYQQGVAYYRGDVSTTTGGYGASWCISSNLTFMSGYIYSVQIVLTNTTERAYNIVTNSSYDMLRLGYSISDASTHTGSTQINYFGSIKDNNGAYINGSSMSFNGNNNAVWVLTYLFTSKLNSQYVCLPFKHYENTSNLTEFFVGAKIDTLGLANIATNSSIGTAISNSGLATATSVQQVQSSINQVQQEIQGTTNAIENQTQQQQENHEETINTITDDTPPDNLNALSNSAGWLPAGPVDSILNLPLSFLTNLNNNLSKSCSPVVLPLPYINKNIELPCLNSIYNQINGLPAWLNTIGTIASAFILFQYLIGLYKYIDDTLTFRENNFIDNWSGV